MTDKHLLVEHLHRLEHQAATVAALIDFDDADLVQQIADAWAPNGKRQQTAWLEWLRDTGDCWQHRPPQHPAGEDVADLLLAWCRRT